METWIETAENYRRNCEYAWSELERLRRKRRKKDSDLKRISVLEQIYYEQKVLYKQCMEIAERFE